MPEVLSPLKIPRDAGSGKVATSDAAGNLTWASPPAASATVFDGGVPSTVFTADHPNIDCGGVT